MIWIGSLNDAINNRPGLGSVNRIPELLRTLLGIHMHAHRLQAECDFGQCGHIHIPDSLGHNSQTNRRLCRTLNQLFRFPIFLNRSFKISGQAVSPH